MMHQMRLLKTEKKGKRIVSQVWGCPDCGREVKVFHQAHKTDILNEGDIGIAHSGGGRHEPVADASGELWDIWA